MMQDQPCPALRPCGTIFGNLSPAETSGEDAMRVFWGEWFILGEKKVEAWTCLRRPNKDHTCISRSAPLIPLLGPEMR